jgi:hypothetical protein
MFRMIFNNTANLAGIGVCENGSVFGFPTSDSSLFGTSVSCPIASAGGNYLIISVINLCFFFSVGYNESMNSSKESTL